MRAIRFSGSGRTEAPFSCLLAPMLLINMLLIRLGSDMTTAVWILGCSGLLESHVPHRRGDDREKMRMRVLGSSQWISLPMPPGASKDPLGINKVEGTSAAHFFGISIL